MLLEKWNVVFVLIYLCNRYICTSIPRRLILSILKFSEFRGSLNETQNEISFRHEKLLFTLVFIADEIK